MFKIFHSLRFQLPAVVLGVFVGILFLLMLFFHEMNTILVKTRQLAESAEVNDYITSWLATLSSCARERTKLFSLGEEKYLRTLQVTLNEVNDLKRDLDRIHPDVGAASTLQLRELHGKHLEYMELLSDFAQDQTIRLAAARAAAAAAKAAPPKPVPVPEKKRVQAGSKAGKKSVAKKAGKGRTGRAATAKSAKSGVLKPKAVQAPGPEATAPAKELGPPKEVELDSATNETFKAYELTLREGLFESQEIMRGERKDKLESLRNSVGRAKDRLIYSLLLLLAMVGYVAVILKWKILDPMKCLKKGAMEIGKGSLGYQVKVTSRNEIGELAEVFNRMSVQLDEKRNAEMRLKRLEAIEQIVRSVNHEINNPLMIISGNAEYLLAVMEGSDEGLKSKLGSIIGEVRRIFLVTQRLKEIKEPITEDYIGSQDKMIDLLRSSQIRRRNF
jgi:hypothetical protein